MPKFLHTLFQLSCWTGLLLQHIYFSRRRSRDAKELQQNAKSLRSDVYNMSREFEQGTRILEKRRDQNEEHEYAGQWLQEWAAEMQKREEYMATRGVRAGYMYCMAYAILCGSTVDTNS
jgi:hypothetical protein